MHLISSHTEASPRAILQVSMLHCCIFCIWNKYGDQYSWILPTISLWQSHFCKIVNIKTLRKFSIHSNIHIALRRLRSNTLLWYNNETVEVGPFELITHLCGRRFASAKQYLRYSFPYLSNCRCSCVGLSFMIRWWWLRVYSNDYMKKNSSEICLHLTYYS